MGIDTFRDLVDCHDESDEDTDCLDDEEEEDDEENDGEDIDEQQQQNSDEEEESDEEDYVPNESGEESDSDYDFDNESELTENDELATIQRQQQQQSNNNEQKLLQSKKPGKASQKANAARNTELNLCPEMVNDKIFNMDFRKWSKEFTHNVSTQNGSAFQQVISMLNESDKNILKKILN